MDSVRPAACCCRRLHRSAAVRETLAQEYEQFRNYNGLESLTHKRRHAALLAENTQKQSLLRFKDVDGFCRLWCLLALLVGAMLQPTARGRTEYGLLGSRFIAGFVFCEMLRRGSSSVDNHTGRHRGLCNPFNRGCKRSVARLRCRQQLVLFRLGFSFEVDARL